MSDTKQHKWSIYLRIRGIAKGCRKSAYHSVDLALADDDGTDESKPLLGGHDLQTMGRKVCEGFRAVDSADIIAMPMVYSNEGMFKSQSFQMFDPRKFGAVLLDISGKPYRKVKS